MNHPKRPRDLAQLAYTIAGIATGTIEEELPQPKNPAAVALGKLGGAKGGKARAKALIKQQRARIAKIAAKARWGESKSKKVKTSSERS